MISLFFKLMCANIKTTWQSAFGTQILKQQSLGRANTFFNKYSDAGQLAAWFIDTFFPFFMENETLILKIDFDGAIVPISKSFIEKNIKQVPFFVKLDENTAEDTPFHLWLVEAATRTPKSRNQVEGTGGEIY